MTAPTVFDPKSVTVADQDSSILRLGRLVSGNDNLVTQPGLVQALFNNNATPAQAQTIDKFLAGLDAERQVRAAQASGKPLWLSDDQKAALTAMNVDYSLVAQTPQDHLTQLKTAMAAQGKQPMLDDLGNVKTDEAGNVYSQPLAVAPEKKKKRHGLSRFLHDLGNNPVTSLVVDGTFDTNSPNPGFNAGGLKGLSHAATSSWNYVSAIASNERDYQNNPIRQAQQNPLQALVQGNPEDADLMQRLGYDPNSVFSVQAFRARGLSHGDTTHAADEFDAENPTGLFGGKHGADLVTDAEVFAAGPEKFVQAIYDDPSLTDEQKVAKVAELNNPAFGNLVKRVNAARATIGNDFATGLGIDPVHHAGLYTATSISADLTASLFIDPLAVGMQAYRGVQLSRVAIQNLNDVTSIGRILDKANTAGSARKVQGLVQDVVDAGNRLKHLSPDDAEAIAINARLKATNPYYGYVADVMGTNQKIGSLSEQAVARFKAGDETFATGPGKPLATYDELVDHILNQGGLLRLTHGLAPIDTSFMPGALSSRAFMKIKGGLSEWSAVRSAARDASRESDFIAYHTADPERFKAAIDNKFLMEVLPQADDAVDVLSGRVIIAAREQADAALAASQRWGQAEAAAADVARRRLAGSDATSLSRADRAQIQSDVDRTANQAARARVAANESYKELLSAQRAAAERAATVPQREPGIYVTDAGRGEIGFNVRTSGNAVGGASTQIGNVVLSPGAFTPAAIAARARLATQRFLVQLPRDREIQLSSNASVDTIYKMARTYLSSGASNQLAIRWAQDPGARKQIVDGLKESLAHASGMTRTKAGQELLAFWKAAEQRYMADGNELLDRDGTPAAMWPAQIETHFIVPNFGQMHMAAAKAGLWEATLGNALGGAKMALATGLWKIGALMRPVTAARAVAEAELNSIAEHLFTNSLVMKAALRDMGGLVGYAGRSKAVDWLTGAAWRGHGVLWAGDLGRFYRHILTRNMTEEEAEYAKLYMQHVLPNRLMLQSSQHTGLQIDPAGLTDVEAAAAQGLKVRQVKFDPTRGWTPELHRRVGFEFTDKLDGIQGAKVYADELGRRFGHSGDLTSAIAKRIREGKTGEPSDIIAALEAPGTKNVMELGRYGRVFWDSKGIQRDAITQGEIDLGKSQYADRLADEASYLLTGRNANLNDNLLSYIEKHGSAPDADWISDHVQGMARPAGALAPKFEAVIDGGQHGWLHGLLDKSGRMYQLLVERPIQRHATAPMHSAAFVHQMKTLQSTKQEFIEGGLSEESANKLIMDMADQAAWQRMARMVDDPNIRLQMDVVGRGFFAFSRATTLMMRRWGATFWKNPAAARRFQLTAEAAIHSGVVDKDENGAWIFHFPGSGVAQELLFNTISKLPWFHNLAKFPVSDMTGNVTSIIPGSTDPFQYSTTPMVSIAGREIAKLFPGERELFDSVDQLFNGSAGQGQGALETVMPTAFKSFWQALGPDDKKSLVAGSTKSAIYSLAAAGMIPPEGASDRQLDDFYRRVESNAKSQLFVKAALGFFSPARINSPEFLNDSTQPDYAYAKMGARGLRDEFKRLVNLVHGDIGRASAMWTTMHPDEYTFNPDGSIKSAHIYSVFTQSGSHSTTSKAVLPSTDEAYHWLTDNAGFVKKYGTIAAYFIPEPQAGDEFSMRAYRAELEQGLREQKTPDEFYQGVRIASDGAIFYPTRDKYQEQINQAKLARDTTAEKFYTAQYNAWRNDFMLGHPLFQSNYNTAGNEAHENAKKLMGDLRDAIANNAIPDKSQVPVLNGMLSAYDAYENFIAAHKGGTDVAIAKRSAAAHDLQDYLSGVVAAHPNLRDVYRGIFRGVDFNLDDIPAGG